MRCCVQTAKSAAASPSGPEMASMGDHMLPLMHSSYFCWSDCRNSWWTFDQIVHVTTVTLLRSLNCKEMTQLAFVYHWGAHASCRVHWVTLPYLLYDRLHLTSFTNCHNQSRESGLMWNTVCKWVDTVKARYRNRIMVILMALKLISSYAAVLNKGPVLVIQHLKDAND